MSSTFNMGTSTPPKSGKKRSKPKRQPGLHTGPMDLPSFTLNKPQLPNDAHLRVPPQQFGSTGFNFAAQTQLPSTPTYPFANNVFKSDTSALPRAQNVNPNPMYAPATTHFGQAPFGEPSKPFDYSTSKRAFAFDELKKETVRVEKEAKPDTDSTFNKWTQLGELHADIWGQILKEREEWMELRREKQTWKDDEMNARQYVEHAASLRAAEEQKLAACQTEVAALKSEYDKLIAGIKEQEAKLEEVKGARAMEELQLTRDKENRRRQAMAFQLARDREEKMSKASSGSKSPPQVNVEVKADEAVSDFRNKQSSRLDFTAEITKHKNLYSDHFDREYARRTPSDIMEMIESSNGVHRTLKNETEVKAAIKEGLRAFHPDKHQQDDAKRQGRCAAIFEVLTRLRKMRSYDKYPPKR